MSHGHNKNKGFSQTSKRYDGDLKEQHQRGRSSQHSSETAKTAQEDKSSQKAPGAKPSQGSSSKQ